MIVAPFLISSTIGILLINLLFKNEKSPNVYLKTILGIGLGLGISSQLTFYSFLFFNRLIPNAIMAAHGIILSVLLIQQWFISRTTPFTFSLPKFSWKNSSSILLILIVLIFLIKQGLFYPDGGWDAWQVWNFKAKFLLLAGEQWQNLFSPQLWRSSPHYPLLLPLINVWGWLWTPKATNITPLTTSILFAVLTGGLLSSALWEQSKNIFSLLPGLLFLTVPFINLLATTQYCDIVLSFYLLASIIALCQTQKQQHSPWALSAGLLSGFLSFTKPEGLIATLIISFLVVSLPLWGKLRQLKDFSLAHAQLFLLGLTIASLPTLAFNVIYSPGNQTFVNGLTSTLKPATWERFQLAMIFLLAELKNGKWHGLWFLLLLGFIIGGKKLWDKNTIITAGFLLLYLSVILAYYHINTYFEIKWWLSVSLHRILFSLLPLFLFWVFGSLLNKNNRS
ncbi:MAG: hypothetical protein H6753_00220 [Candidatus Omnitrophica bacterium]|nr:hypothetical protein [Candidatus Omnitrophota bacterium]